MKFYLKFLTYACALPVILFSFSACNNGNVNPKPVPDPSPVPSATVQLTFAAPGGQAVNMTGVRVGEYYWMNANINVPEYRWPMPTVAEIDAAHAWYNMFNYENGTGKTYWDYFADQGLTQTQALADFNKYYGGSYKLHTEIKDGVVVEDGSSALGAGWSMPNSQALLQLVAMCGKGTMPEVEQYLSFGGNQPDAPSVAKISGPGFYWFFPQKVNVDKYKGDNFSDQNTNIYHFNAVPASDRMNGPYDQNNGIRVAHLQAGDFNGLNQKLVIPGKFGTSDTCLVVSDNSIVQAELSYHYFPIRYCRRLSDKELGYKLYISHMKDTNGNIISEKQLIQNVHDGKINPTAIHIKKLGLTDHAPVGFTELPNGYIRGFYVQYFIENIHSAANPTKIKTVADIINIGVENIDLNRSIFWF